jgi:hypothetical protein
MPYLTHTNLKIICSGSGATKKNVLPAVTITGLRKPWHSQTESPSAPSLKGIHSLILADAVKVV